MIIVTGGAGFIGSALVWKLNQEGIDDILIVDNLNISEKWKNLLSLRYRNYFHKDYFYSLILETEDIGFKVEGVFHLGACSSTVEQDMDYLMENNFRYTRFLASWCLEQDIPFVYASSAATYGDIEKGFSDQHDLIQALRPINRYGYSKHVFDLWALRNQILDQITGVKFFNVFGPNEYHKDSMKSVVCKAYSQITETGALKLFKSYRDNYKDGEQKRDFVYVKDCVDVLWWLFNNPKAMGIFNLGTGKARSWNDLGHAVFKAMGQEPMIEYIDMPDDIRNQYQYFTQADMKKLKKAGCPVKFSSLEDSVSDYVKGYLSQGLVGYL